MYNSFHSFNERKHDWGRPQAGLTDLFDRIESRRAQQRAQAFIEAVSKRGIMVSAVAALLVLAWWRHSSHAVAADGAGPTLHCHFLIDRSGSMSSLAPAVVAGFNRYVEQQASQPGAMLLTLAQFNSQFPFELKYSGRDIRKVRPLSAADFQPRGSTPLYDALGALMDNAARGCEGAECVVVVFSDGQENASHKLTRERVFAMIEARRKEGWTFVFLGGNQDSYAASKSLSMAAGATSNFVADERGVRAAWSDLSAGSTRARMSLRSGRVQTAAEKAAYLEGSAAEGFRSAERDYAQRGGAHAARGATPAGGGGTGGAANPQRKHGRRRRVLRHAKPME